VTQSAGDRINREAFADSGERPFAVMQATMTAVFGGPGIRG